MCTLTADAECELPVSPLAPAAARTFLASQSCGRHSASVLEDAKLLVSELVTNAVAYGGPPLVLRVSCDGTEGLRVDVRDGRPDLPPKVPAEPGDDLAEHGRGLDLVELISADWGVRPEPEGKAVWFRLQPS